jgi:hypothetical protein
VRDALHAGDDVLMHTPIGAPVFGEERPPPLDPNNPDAIAFKLHGYFRAPFLMSWTRRPSTTPGEGKFELRSPYLIDNDFYNSGFAYTPVNETPYGELFLMAGNRSLTATVALMGAEFSDSSEVHINNQMGFSQGYLTYRYDPHLLKGVKTHLQIKGGAFWDRFGYLEHYDTYIFGRTHQVGYQARLDAEYGDWHLSLLQGLGAHLENVQANQAFSLLNTLRLAATYKTAAEVGIYYLRSWSQDKPPLTQLQDADMLVLGADARLNSPTLGRLYLAGSSLSAHESLFLSPTIETLHSLGGTGLTDNYFGTTGSDNGTGDILSVGWQYDYSLATLLRHLQPGSRPLAGGDMTLSFYGLYSYVESQQASSDPSTNKNERKYYKYGLEYGYWALPWAGLSTRYDRVVLDVDDDRNSFRIFSARFNLRARWMGEGLIYLQYSHYFYGDRITLRPGQEPGVTTPDENVAKLQAQMNF